MCSSFRVGVIGTGYRVYPLRLRLVQVRRHRLRVAIKSWGTWSPYDRLSKNGIMSLALPSIRFGAAGRPETFLPWNQWIRVSMSMILCDWLELENLCTKSRTIGLSPPAPKFFLCVVFR